MPAWPSPVVAFESPRRLPRALAALAEAMPDREAAVCRELTKRFEEVVRGSLEELARRFEEPPRGEVTVVLGSRVLDDVVEPDVALAAVGELVSAGISRRSAVDLVARLTGASRNVLYRRSL